MARRRRSRRRKRTPAGDLPNPAPLQAGATMDAVAAALGTPAYLSAAQWSWSDGAYVTFGRDGVLDGWSDPGGRLGLPAAA